MTNGLLIYGEIFAHVLGSPSSYMTLCNCSNLNFPIYEEIWFSFLSVYCDVKLSLLIDTNDNRLNGLKIPPQNCTLSLIYKFVLIVVQCWSSWRGLIVLRLRLHWQKEHKNFLIYKEIQRDQVKSPIWLTASSYMINCFRISSYIHIYTYI